MAVTRLAECYTALKNASLRQDLGSTVCARGLLLQLFALYVDLPEAPQATLGHRALTRFCESLRMHGSPELRLEQIAAETGLTAGHLRELFRHRFGMRPVEYRRGLQLARARELLSSTNLNVKEAAREAGYRDPLYFSRIFKRQFGISPSSVVR